MSADSSGWAYKYSPYKGATFAVHLAIGDSANDQHEFQFWMSLSKLARKARVSRRSATEAVRQMIEDGFLTPLHDDMGKAWVSGRPVNYRMEMPDDLPLIYDPKARVGVAVSSRGGSEERQGGLAVVATLPLATTATGDSSGCAQTKEEPKRGKPKKNPTEPDPPSEEVVMLCTLLADLMVENGCKRPTITTTWHDAARLMISADRRPVSEAARLIRWCQADSFWRSNVMSMPKFRDRYDTLKLRMDERRGGGRVPAHDGGLKNSECDESESGVVVL